MSGPYNLLVISDLHLGEDLGASRGRSRHVDETEAALIAFLDHYAAARQGGLPWALVINGDMVDFLGVHLAPGDVGVEGSADDLTFGFGASEVAARAKLTRVVERHRAFFGALARFLAADHALHLVVGNHDAEFHWPEVQADFRAAIARELPPERAGVEAAIAFHPWFWYEPGVAWIEHGHQYDGYCSFEDPLYPENPGTPGVLEENLGTAAMRYLGNHLPVSPDATNDLSFVEYLTLIANSQSEARWKFVGGYAAVVRALGSQWLARMRDPDAFRARKEHRRERMKEISLASSLRLATLERLHRLRRPPVFMNLLRWVRSIMLGRLILTVVALAMVPFVMVLIPWVGVWFAVAFASVVAVLHLWLAWGRENVDPTEEMRKTAHKVHLLVRTPVVSFGHSHVPLAHRLGRNGWYFNSGSWAGGAERPNAFTHLLVVRAGDRVRASLCRWRGGESRELRAESPRVERPEPLGAVLGV